MPITPNANDKLPSIMSKYFIVIVFNLSFHIKKAVNYSFTACYICTGGEARTPDTRFWRPVLYQLSYSRVCGCKSSANFWNQQTFLLIFFFFILIEILNRWALDDKPLTFFRWIMGMHGWMRAFDTDASPDRSWKMVVFDLRQVLLLTSVRKTAR